MPRRLVKKEQARRIFSSSYDNAIMKYVLATHAPDGREVDHELLLGVIEETFRHSVPVDIDSIINKGEDTGVPNGLANVVHTVSCEFSCKSSGATDAHASTLAILNMLSSYTWEAKVVISLGAFAINYGEFWLVAQLFATNPLARLIAFLKHMPNVIEHYKALKTRFDAINLLIKAMLDVTKSIITFKNLPHQYFQDDQPPKLTATTHIPSATYWSIKSMVACTSQLTSLLGMNYEYITATSEAWELSSLIHKVRNIHEHLNSVLVLCYQNIEEKQQEEYNLTRMRISKARDGKPASNSSARSHKIVMSHQPKTDSSATSHKIVMSHQTREDVTSETEMSQISLGRSVNVPPETGFSQNSLSRSSSVPSETKIFQSSLSRSTSVPPETEIPQSSLISRYTIVPLETEISQSSISRSITVPSETRISQSSLSRSITIASETGFSQSSLRQSITVPSETEISQSPLSQSTIVALETGFSQSSLSRSNTVASETEFSQSSLSRSSNVASETNFSQSSLSQSITISSETVISQTSLSRSITVPSETEISQSSVSRSTTVAPETSFSQSSVSRSTTVASGTGFSQSSLSRSTTDVTEIEISQSSLSRSTSTTMRFIRPSESDF